MDLFDSFCSVFWQRVCFFYLKFFFRSGPSQVFIPHRVFLSNTTHLTSHISKSRSTNTCLDHCMLIWIIAQRIFIDSFHFICLWRFYMIANILPFCRLFSDVQLRSIFHDKCSNVAYYSECSLILPTTSVKTFRSVVSYYMLHQFSGFSICLFSRSIFFLLILHWNNI